MSAEDPLTGFTKHTASAYLTMVGVNSSGQPIPIPQIIPQTADEKRRWQDAESDALKDSAIGKKAPDYQEYL